MFFSTRVKNVLVAFTLGVSLVVVNATEVMHRPDNFKSSPHTYAQGKSNPKIITKRSGAKVNMAYFTNW